MWYVTQTRDDADPRVIGPFPTEQAGWDWIEQRGLSIHYWAPAELESPDTFIE